MTRPAQLPSARAAAAFTLIEMIGVLAIISILASVLVPNVLRSMDRAAVRAETATLTALGEQARLFLRVNGTLPNPTAPDLTNLATLPTRASWCRDLGSLGDIAPYDIAVNKRAMPRVYLVDPSATPAPRVMILSSMRAGMGLPANNLTTVQFDAIWNTADTDIPPNASWAGWNAWRTRDPSNSYFIYREYLQIERIDLRAIYHAELASFLFRLNNRDAAATVSFDYTPPFGAGGSGTVVPGGYAEVTLAPRARLNFYRDAARTMLDYTYIVGTAGRTQTFDFKDGTWTPQ
jgi:prepilin-type N-terminal cleavage/methylation domain-containing protein